MKLLELRKGNIVYDEGDHADLVYFIRKGDIGLKRKAPTRDPNSDYPIRLTENKLEKMKAKKLDFKDKYVLLGNRSEGMLFGD